MIIYDFYSDRTSGPMVDYLCTIIPHTKLVDYQLIEVDQDGVRNPREPEDIKSMAKLFTFGCEGTLWRETFHILIDEDDDVKISIGSRLSAAFKANRIEVQDISENLVAHLTKVARDYKIKQVIQ